jgi:hydrogenase nickel incorporation protein HypA/HybF
VLIEIIDGGAGAGDTETNMHEVSICEGIKGVIDDQALKHGFSAVRRITLEIGAFARVEITSLEFAFDAVMRGSVAEGALLEIVDLPGRAWCLDCATVVEFSDRLADCPHCGGGRLLPEGGDEMRIKNLEVI